MTAEIINLRRARKAKSRSEAEEKAADNRVRFGRPKRERTRAEAERSLQDRRHEGHRLATPPEGPGESE